MTKAIIPAVLCLIASAESVEFASGTVGVIDCGSNSSVNQEWEIPRLCRGTGKV